MLQILICCIQVFFAIKKPCFSGKTDGLLCIFKIFFVFFFTQPATGGENDLLFPFAAFAAD